MGYGNTLGEHCDLENKESPSAELKGSSQLPFRCHGRPLLLGLMTNTSVSFIEEWITKTGNDLKSRLCFQKGSK